MSLVGEDGVTINIDGPIVNDCGTAIELFGSPSAETNMEAFDGSRNDETDKNARTAAVRLYQRFKILASRWTDRVKHSMFVYVSLTCVAFSFWFSSLAGCEGELIACAGKLADKAFNLTMKVALFSLFNYIMLVYAYHQTDSVSRRLGYLIVCLSYVYIHNTSNGFSQADHSKLNIVIAYLLLLLYLTLTVVIFASVKLYRKSKTACLVLVLLAIIACAILYRVKVTSSCDRLNESLHPDYKYEDNDKLCKWRLSNICWHYVITGMFRPLFWWSSAWSPCEFSTTNVDLHRKVAGDSGIVSFILSQQIGYEKRLYYEIFQSELNRSMRDEPSNNLECGYRESYMDFRESPEGKYVIKLRDQRKNPDFNRKLLPHDNDHMNILHIFIDTVSRQRVYRTMKKTVEILKKYHFSRNEKIRVYEFFRHHALAGYTWPNLMSSMYGSIDDSLIYYSGMYNQHRKRIETFAKEKGYITGFANNFCNVNEKELEKRIGFTIERQYVDPLFPDHEFVHPGCDYNSFPKRSFGFLYDRGPFSSARKCFMKRDTSEYSFQYMFDFFNTYKEERKYFKLRMIDPHEGTEELTRLIDQQVADMFTRMIDAGHMDNTLVHFYSDHGDHMNFLISDTESYANEKFNPFLYVMMPDHTRDTMHETVLNNTQRLVSHKDIFASDMIHLGYASHPQMSGVSYLDQQVPESRSCADIGLLFIKECKCIDQA